MCLTPAGTQICRGFNGNCFSLFFLVDNFVSVERLMFLFPIGVLPQLSS